MSKKDEALKLALEALEWVVEQGGGPNCEHEASVCFCKENKAITAIREALAEQPAQEPVATMWQHGETGRTRITMPGDITDCDARWFKAADLYTSPPGGARTEDGCSAASKPWVGLTDEDTRKINQEVWGYVSADHTRMWSYARAIEAKLREKNE